MYCTNIHLLYCFTIAYVIYLEVHQLKDSYRILLENKFEITQHYPEGTEAFHISEVRAFYCITGLYFAKVGKIELAYKSYFLLSDLDINAQVTSLLGHPIIG